MIDLKATDWLARSSAVRTANPGQHPCVARCQHAIDVGMPEVSCATRATRGQYNMAAALGVGGADEAPLPLQPSSNPSLTSIATATPPSILEQKVLQLSALTVALEAALSELVQLKDLKDSLDAERIQRDAMQPEQRPAKSKFVLRDEIDYAVRKPQAWCTARAVLDLVRTTAGANTGVQS